MPQLWVHERMLVTEAEQRLAPEAEQRRFTDHCGASPRGVFDMGPAARCLAPGLEGQQGVRGGAG